MAYNNEMDRGGSQALMPEDVSHEILGKVSEDSAIMKLAKRLPDMSRKQRRLPVWQSLPQAYFVNGDRGRKQTTDARWDNVFLNAEELAVIVPIPDAVMDDVDYDIWAEVKPAVVTAIGAAFDKAVLYGIGSPADWPDALLDQIQSHGHAVTLGSQGDLYDDIMGEGGVLSKVEEDGFAVNGHIAALSLRAKMRGLRDEDGRPIFASQTGDNQGAFRYALDGEPVVFPTNGAIDPARALLVSGDWNELVFAVRQDITYKVLTEAVITDASGAVIFNLAQDDMSALRVVFRVGWALPNPINLVNTNAFTRFPFASLEPVAAS
jgi:HK97 family phage major capsid protein